MTLARFLGAVGFVAFCVTGAATALSRCYNSGVPWFAPFAVTAFVVGVVGGAILIVDPRAYRDD